MNLPIKTAVGSRRVFVAAALVLLAAGCGGSAGRKAAYIEHGQKYFAEKNYEKARIEFGNALQIDPRDAQAHFLAGQVAEKLADPRQAVAQYQAAVDLDPKLVAARATLARLFVLGGLPDKAVELVEAGLASAPGNAQLLTARAAARQRLGNMPGAQQDAETAVKLAPGDEFAVSVLASVYKAQGNAEKAIDVVRSGLQQRPDNIDLHIELADLDVEQNHMEEAEAQLKKVVELQPANLDYRNYLVRFYLLNKNTDAAEQALRDAVALSPGQIAPKLALVNVLAAQRGAERADAQLDEYIKADPGNDELKLALADHLLSEGKAEQAERSYREVIAHAGSHPEGLSARDHLAALMLERNDTAQAASLIAEVLKENPGDSQALLLRSSMALARGDASAAITDLRAVLRDQPNAVPVLRQLARAHLQNNEPALAENALRSAVQVSPKDFDSRFELARVLQQTGKLDQARSLLEQLSAEGPEQPALPQALFEVQMNQNDLAAARDTADKLKLSHPELALGFYLAGLVDEKEQKPAAASAEFERALAVQPQSAQPLAELVKLDVSGKQAAKALERLNATIDKFPDNIAARALKGELLQSQGRYDAAAQVYQEAIAKEPHAWALYEGLAGAQLKLNRNDAAVQTLAEGIRNDPDAPRLTTDLALLYERSGRIDDAIALYEAALKRNPAAVSAANNLAVLLINHRQDSVSLARAAQLASQFEQSSEPALLDTRGWVKYKSGNFKEAVPLLEQAVEKSPALPEFRYHLGMAQFKSGNSSGAQKNLSMAINSAQAFVGIDEARSTLQEVRRQSRN